MESYDHDQIIIVSNGQEECPRRKIFYIIFSHNVRNVVISFTRSSILWVSSWGVFLSSCRLGKVGEID